MSRSVRPTTTTHALADGEVRLLGAATTVTGAMTRIDVGATRLLVDCGIGQGRDAAAWRFPDEALDAHAVILTHGHQDHIGALPTLFERGWDGPIWTTAATFEVASLSLRDSLHIADVGDREIDTFLQQLRRRVRFAKYDAPFSPHAGFSGTITLRDAGHILGSASVELGSERSRVVLSGDLGRPDSPILGDPFTAWGSARPVDLVVCECTYGDRDHQHDAASIEQQLLAAIRPAIAARGKVLIPAFAIGRTQVLLYHLNTLVESGQLPPIPVMVDTPLGQAITETHNRFRQLFDKESLDKLARGDDPLDFRSLYAVRSGRDSYRLDDQAGPLIIIAGSGMCQGGRILHHLTTGLDDERNTVLFVGYQSPGTLGRRILEAAPGSTVRVGKDEVVVRARTQKLDGLSAHADRNELVAWLRHIPGTPAIALHHGEATAQAAFASWAESRL